MRISLPLLLLLFPVASAAGQDEQLEELVAQLEGASSWRDRVRAARDLAAIGPPAVPHLTRALGDPKCIVRSFAAKSLGRIGEPSSPAVPHLIRALALSELEEGGTPHFEDSGHLQINIVDTLRRLGSEAVLKAMAAPDLPQEARSRLIDNVLEEGDPGEAGSLLAILVDLRNQGMESDRDYITGALSGVGSTLKRQGLTYYWLVPWAFRYEALLLLAGSVAYFVVLSRFYSRRQASKLPWLAQVGATAATPTLLGGYAVYYALTRDWATGYIPEPFLAVVPFPVAAVLSTAFLSLLSAIWVCTRKPAAAQEEESASNPA